MLCSLKVGVVYWRIGIPGWALAWEFVIIAAYYLSREWVTPGYLGAGVEGRIGRAFSGKEEQTPSPFLLVLFSSFAKTKLSALAVFSTSGAFSALRQEESVARLLLYALLIVLFLFFLLSASQTKIRWYIAPAYPFLALIAGAGIAWLIRSFAHVFPRFKVWDCSLTCHWGFLFPYRDAVRRSLDPRNENPQNQYAHFIRQVSSHGWLLSG
jgi:4-amino-4-deoxy-L-arabinose transferase-like glycosyltransferase